MLISITEKCRMGCTHCMEDARPDNEHFMSFETFKKAVDFNFEFDRIITISGAEPTEHPDFWNLMFYLAEKMNRNTFCTVVTNGMNLSNDDISKVKAIRKKCKGEFLWQVTTVKPYYPIQIDTSLDIFKLPEFVITTELDKLEKRGRAANHPEWNFTAKAPQCFNFRSIIRSTRSFGKAIFLLRARMKFCTPKINYEGYIKCGESNLCPNAAHIDEPLSVITEKICSFTCNNKNCRELLDKWPQQYRDAIGEK